jgi:hypothetical protein
MVEGSGQISNIMLVLAGTLIISIHFVLAMTTKHVFGILVVIYVIAFGMLSLSFIKKKRPCMTQMEYDFAFYTIAFIISIQVMTFILQLYFLLLSDNKPSYQTMMPSRYY